MKQEPRYFRLTNWDKHQNFRGKRAHWMKLSLDFFDDPIIVGLPDSQRLAFIGVMILCGKRGNCVPFDATYIKKRCSLRVTPDLDLFLAQGLIEITQAVSGAKPFPRYVEESRGEKSINGSGADDAPAPPPPAPKTPPVEPTALVKARVLSVEPLPWNREAAELWHQEYRGDPPKAFFAALKPLVKRETWERVRPALVTYMAETPAEYVNIAGKFVAAFGTWEARARGRPPTRVSEKARARDQSDMAMIRAGMKGGGLERHRVGTGADEADGVPALAAGRDAGAEGDPGS